VACAASGGVWQAATQQCSELLITPPAVNMLPVGYDPTAGTVAPSNTSGLTTVSTATVAKNAANQAACLDAGGTWDTTNGCTMPPDDSGSPPPTSNNSDLIVIVGVVAVVLLVAFTRGR
jgi:hypothetical protein